MRIGVAPQTGIVYEILPTIIKSRFQHRPRQPFLLTALATTFHHASPRTKPHFRYEYEIAFGKKRYSDADVFVQTRPRSDNLGAKLRSPTLRRRRYVGTTRIPLFLLIHIQIDRGRCDPNVFGP